MDLTPGKVSREQYNAARDTLIRACHDVFIEYENEDGEKKMLLVVRDNEPALGQLWPIGGGIKRGIPTIESLRLLTKSEM